MTTDEARAIVDRKVVSVIVPQLYEVINALLNEPTKQDINRARRLLPHIYSESFASKAKS